jgi:hypothetical protein
MKAKLPVLWLALLATLVLGAAGSSTAAAKQAEFTAASYPAVYTMRKITNEKLYFEIKGDTVECTTTHLEASLVEAVKVITATPHFTGCKNKAGINVTVDLNQCHFTVEALTYTPLIEMTTHATAGVKCANAKEAIKVTAATCTVHIPEQTGLKTLALKNIELINGQTPKPWFRAEFNITNLTYTETDGFLCPFEGENHAADGKIVGPAEVKGFTNTASSESSTTTGKIEYTHGVMQEIDVK